MTFLQRLDTWHQTVFGLITFAVVELALGYLFVSLAINSGSLWQWTLGFVSVVGCGRNLFLLAKKVFRHVKNA
jgi:hypothetical protein